ncbi:MAG: hypothetical protein RMM08_13550, partial [Armatimonadota bacterium]|nr:hypothetical protein [Armatimonadota bacterium]
RSPHHASVPITCHGTRLPVAFGTRNGCPDGRHVAVGGALKPNPVSSRYRETNCPAWAPFGKRRGTPETRRRRLGQGAGRHIPGALPAIA